MVGIGNADRGDDAAGRAVLEQLRGRVPAGVEVVQSDAEVTTLLAGLPGSRIAVIVDACRSGAPAGTVHRFDVSEGPLPEVRVGLSTHSAGLGDAIELARALGELPGRFIVYAIEGQAFGPGAGLSAAVAAVIGSVADRVLLDLAGDES